MNSTRHCPHGSLPTVRGEPRGTRKHAAFLARANSRMVQHEELGSPASEPARPLPLPPPPGPRMTAAIVAADNTPQVPPRPHLSPTRSAGVWHRAGCWARWGLAGPPHERRVADRSRGLLVPTPASEGLARRAGQRRGVSRGESSLQPNRTQPPPQLPSACNYNTALLRALPPGRTRVLGGDRAPVLVSPGHRLGASPDKLLSRLYLASFLSRGVLQGAGPAG